MLGLKKNNVREYMENGGHFYAKLLGFRKDRQDLLSVIAKKSALPLLTRPVSYTHLFVSFPSDTFGDSRNKNSLDTSSKTASPKNSSLSLQ